MKILRVILGNQLFPISQINLSKDVPIFMAEDSGLCSYIKHHKSKIALFFSAMRSYRDQLKNNSYKVIYYDANNNFSTSYFDKLFDVVKSNKIKKIAKEVIQLEINALKNLKNSINNSFFKIISPVSTFLFILKIV